MATETVTSNADAFVRKGIRLATQGDSASALECLSHAVEMDPAHSLGRLHLGMALTGEGRYDEAEPHLLKALELAADRPAFHIFAGRCFLDAGEHDRAREALDRAIELSPENDLALGYQALLDWADGDTNAHKRLNVHRMPDSTPFLARLLFFMECELKGRPVEYVHEDVVPPFIDRLRIAHQLWRASLARKKGAFDQAAMRTEMVMEMVPGHPAAAAFQRECRAAALDVARRRTEENPDDADLRVELAAALADSEVFAEASEQMAEAIRLLTDKDAADSMEAPPILRLRGRIAYGCGDIEEAEDLFEKGAEPGFAMAEVNYYRGLCRLALGKRHQCLADFEALVAKLSWAVPLRMREYRAWRASPRQPDAGQTSPEHTASDTPVP